MGQDDGVPPVIRVYQPDQSLLEAHAVREGGPEELEYRLYLYYCTGPQRCDRGARSASFLPKGAYLLVNPMKAMK